MFKEKPFNVLLFCIIVICCSAVLQYMNPGYSVFDGGLIAAVLLTLFLGDDLYTKLFAVVSILLVLVSAFYPHENMSRQQIILQHLFSMVVIAVCAVFVLYVKKLYRSIEYDKRQVNALFEHATEGIILTNQKGEIVLVNPAALQLFEFEHDELIGRPVETLIPHRFHHAHVGDRTAFFHDPSNRAMGHGRDLFAKTKSNREFPVEVSLSYYQQNDETFVIAFVVDITQRKRSEKLLLDQKAELERVSTHVRELNTELEAKVEQRTIILREALQELEKSQKELNEALSKEKELSEIKSRFVSMASHEFRTPLSTVLSSAALLSRYTREEEQEKRDKHIRRIKDSVKHLNSLLDDFLSLGRLEEGRVRAEVSGFDVRGFLDEVVEELNPVLKEGQVIRMDFEGNGEFYSDKRLVKNILINLLTNTSKFSADNTSIWLSAHRQDRWLDLSVRDEGIGIAEEDQQHLFSSFFRGKNVLNIEGTGLGLHIVKRYADLLQGDIQLESKLNEGTLVSLRLPDLQESLAN
jgi:PAS domain S-box-containing protein